MDAAIHPAHGADKPAPVPYLGTRIGGLLVKHKGHELPGVIIRRQVCLMGTRDPIAGIAEVYSVGPDYGSGLRHNTRVSDSRERTGQTIRDGGPVVANIGAGIRRVPGDRLWRARFPLRF
jgi:hypothetical protein